MTLRKADCDCLTTAVVKSAHPWLTDMLLLQIQEEEAGTLYTDGVSISQSTGT